jgi:hypothetical protein
VAVAGFDERCFRGLSTLGLRWWQRARDERPPFCEIVAEVNVPRDDCDPLGCVDLSAIRVPFNATSSQPSNAWQRATRGDCSNLADAGRIVQQPR